MDHSIHMGKKQEVRDELWSNMERKMRAHMKIGCVWINLHDCVQVKYESAIREHLLT